MNIADITEIVKSIFDLEIEMRIVSAIFLGFAIGLEREITNKYAGLRTNILVCVGSCIFTILSIYGFPEVSVLGDELGTRDTARVAAQVVTGIGFIGGGTVLRHGTSVYGLTTAATLWLAASIGMACACKMYYLALFVTPVVVGVIVLIRFFEKKFLGWRHPVKAQVFLHVKKDCVEPLHSALTEKGRLLSFQKKVSEQNVDMCNIRATIMLKAQRPVDVLYQHLSQFDNSDSLTIQEIDEKD